MGSKISYFQLKKCVNIGLFKNGFVRVRTWMLMKAMAGKDKNIN